MSTFDQLRDGFGRALYSIAEGWHQLRQRAVNALTHFTPRRSGNDIETGAEHLALNAPRWGLLAAELSEEEGQFTVRLEVPGLEPDDFDVQVLDDYLVVRGEKQVQRSQGHGHYHVMECAYGQFERALPLPGPVDESRTKASYRRGVLTITLPKLRRSANDRITIHVES